MPMKRSVRLEWSGEGMRFSGHGTDPRTPPIDIDAENGQAPGPMMVLLLAVAACSGSDVVDILKKMRLTLTGLTVDVDGTRRDEEPRRFTAIHLKYTASGKDLDLAKVRRAAALSIEKHCSVIHSLAPDIKVTTDVALA